MTKSILSFNNYLHRGVMKVRKPSKDTRSSCVEKLKGMAFTRWCAEVPCHVSLNFSNGHVASMIVPSLYSLRDDFFIFIFIYLFLPY